uniref:N-formylglutamate amidohydrolase n=1 Tax=Arenibaculum pallidiluteum TaxID=2812559 RepID=UPI001A973596
RAPVLLLADHAGRAVPRALGRLGVAEPEFERHIAWDIGTAGLTRLLARRFDAPALLGVYSRLVVDLNRALDDPTLMPEISDGTVVPANRALDAAAREARLEAIYRPYHGMVEHLLDGFAGRGVVPAVVSVHSFTPVMRGLARPWHAGVLWDRDPRMAVPLIAGLRADPALVVGDNEPYTGRGAHGTIDRHAVARGLPHVLVEIRQDLIATPEGEAEWAARLADALKPILADPALYRVE